jgi:NAD(P)-dependent dehydrogenase (short-subunit alcohol dehydrogenase family)
MGIYRAKTRCIGYFLPVHPQLLELADYNIRVNCVSPGVIRTRFQDSLTPEQVKANIEGRIPLHREGRPEDVAEVIVTLATNEFMTGETVVVDGGMTMRIA